jgi:hypothetical protein
MRVGDKKGSDRAGEVFRQFAWHLAGTLAKPVPRPGKPRPAVAVKR